MSVNLLATIIVNRVMDKMEAFKVAEITRVRTLSQLLFIAIINK